MVELNKENWKIDHLDGLHKRKEEEYASWCKLCKNYVDAVKDGNLAGDELGVDIRDEIKMQDVFGKTK